MKSIRLLGLLAVWVFTLAEARAADTLLRREWKVDGLVREALVHVPPQAATEATPIIFAFHGHGGSMYNAAWMYGYHRLWPEAIVVFTQGLNTPGWLTDPEGKKPGWQQGIGNQGDRDLKFFDAVLAGLKKKSHVDERRIFATGHSYGGAFTYLLWASRGDRLAAVAPSAATAPRLLGQLKPKPVLHVDGENDPLVKFAWQKQTMDALRKFNECGDGKPWAEHCTVYESKLGMPVVTCIHPGTHQFPETAPALIVKFFRNSQSRPVRSGVFPRLERDAVDRAIEQ